MAILLSIITITLLMFNNELLKPIVSKRTKVPIPIELIIVIGGVLLSKFLKMEETWQIIPVGHIPVGLPQAVVPKFALWKEILVDCFAIAFVSYSVTVSMALIFGQKLKYEIDFNQELLAMVNTKVLFESFCFSIELSAGFGEHSRLVFLLHAVFRVAVAFIDPADGGRRDTIGFTHLLHHPSVCFAVDWAVFRSPAEGEIRAL